MLHVILLAAGEGKRMRSRHPKVLQPVGGRAMLLHLLDAVVTLQPTQTHVVVGQGAEQIKAQCGDFAGAWVHQDQRLGTGHATLQALPDIPNEAQVLVLPGDMPLVRPETLERLVQSSADLAVLSFVADDPTGYGRILRDDHDQVTAIVEQADASVDEAQVREVNAGVMSARCDRFKDWLARIEPKNAQGEYYLTDAVACAVAAGQRVEGVVANDPAECMGANDRAGLASLEHIWQQRQREALLAAGATLEDPSSVWIKGQIAVGHDVVIGPNVTLKGEIDLGDGVVVDTGCVIEDSRLAAGTHLAPYSVLAGVETTGACQVGPFARLRAGTVLAADVKVGNFVEVKQAAFAAGAKASHLSYIGDATVGEGVNIGAGTITCNYDGVAKHTTTIEPGAFIGSNSALVAPITIGADAVIGAGSVIAKDAPANTLSLTRAPQRAIDGWVRPKRKD